MYLPPEQDNFFKPISMPRKDNPVIKTEVARKATAGDVEKKMPALYGRLWEKLRFYTFDNSIKKPDLIQFMWPGWQASQDNDLYPKDAEREIRNMNEELIEIYGKMVGSSPKGYYAIQSEKDFQRAKTYLLQKKLALEDRVGLLDRNWKLLNGVLPDQTEQQKMEGI